MANLKLRLFHLLLSVLLVPCMAVAAQPPTSEPITPTLSSRADDVAKLFCEKPVGFADVFNADFRAAVPDAQLTKLLKGIFASAGRCTEVKPSGPPQDTRGVFLLTFENGSTATVHLAIDADSPHRVSGFFIGPLEHPVKSFDEVISQLKKLPGTTSLYAAEIHDTELKPLAQLNADKPLALGSAFKLYVLAGLINELEAGQRHWDDVVHLTEAAKSLPGGFLQKWPVGAPITIHTLASLMISQSDNTATDLLIRTLGREKVEAMLGTAGHLNPKLNQPFLTTVEMFKIKGDPARQFADEFLAGSLEQRRAMRWNFRKKPSDQQNRARPRAAQTLMEHFACLESSRRSVGHLGQARSIARRAIRLTPRRKSKTSLGRYQTKMHHVAAVVHVVARFGAVARKGIASFERSYA